MRFTCLVEKLKILTGREKGVALMGSECAKTLNQQIVRIRLKRMLSCLNDIHSRDFRRIMFNEVNNTFCYSANCFVLSSFYSISNTYCPLNMCGKLMKEIDNFYKKKKLAEFQLNVSRSIWYFNLIYLVFIVFIDL